MSHTAWVEFPCHTGKGQELLAALAAGLVDTRAFEGCESIEVYTDHDNPDLVTLWEKWGTPENYAAYTTWRMETGFIQAMTAFMDPRDIRVVNLDPQSV